MTYLSFITDNWPYLGDSTSLLILVGTFLDMLPHIAAAFAIIYWGIRIYESDSVQQLLFRYKLWRRRNVEDDQK